MVRCMWLTMFLSRICVASYSNAFIGLCYLWVPSSPFAITYGEDSIETDITGVSGSDSQESWYTIDGIRLSGRPTLPGVYFRLTSGANRKSEKIVIK